jgi:hypothetical protein
MGEEKKSLQPDQEDLLSPERCEEFAQVVDQLGSLTLAAQKTGPRMYWYEVYRLSADEETLNEFREAFGGGIYQNGQESGNIWKVSGRDCRYLLSVLEPYLVRRKAAVEALREVRAALEEEDVSRATSLDAAIERFQQISEELRVEKADRGELVEEVG